MLHLVALAALAIACNKTTASSSVGATDAAKPTRIVSLTPASTEAIVAIGAESELVGRSRFCNYPPSVEPITVVGGYTDPNLEAILGLHPSLVVGVKGPPGANLTESLEPRGISVYLPRVESVKEIAEMLRALGTRTGHRKGGERAAREFETAIANVERAYADAPVARVLLVFGLEPIVVAGKGSFGDELLSRAHAKNVIEEGGAYPTLDAERLLVLDPDVIVNATFGEAAGRAVFDPKSAVGSRLTAVKKKRVVTVTDERVLRPGPRLAEGLRLLAEAIHRVQANVPLANSPIKDAVP